MKQGDAGEEYKAAVMKDREPMQSMTTASNSITCRKSAK